MKRIILFLLTLAFAPLRAEEPSDAVLMKAVALDAGKKVNPSDTRLFQQSIQSTKETIARETLSVFYRDALDAYRSGRYEEALDILNRLYSIDPYYEDIGRLRETIGRLKSNQDFQSKRSILEDYMRKGNRAQAAGQNVAALGFWKQALVVNGSYEPAKKKIRQVNRAMAQKQYEAGYLYYHHGDMEQALNSWSNAIAIDPTFKQRGLMQLISKVQLTLQRDRTAKLTAQGSQQYAEKDYANALQTYEELLNLDPRSEEARRMTGKIKFQLGQAAFNSARAALSQKLYAQAIKHWRESIGYGYETQRSQRGIEEAENFVRGERAPKTASPASSQPKEAAAPTATAAAAPVVAAPAANPEEAKAHYRQGLAAIHSKDFHRAVEELEIAHQLDPNDEYIYVSLQRAKQEWAAMNTGRASQ